MFQVSTNEAELTVLEQDIDEEEMAQRRKLFYAIYQVLLIHQGPIHEFTLSMNVDNSYVEIDLIILHLSKRNTVKILKLEFDDGECDGYRLPLSLFSLHQLTELYIGDCALYFEPSSYDEFSYLTTLYLDRTWTYAKTLLRLLSICPSLKRLTLISRNITNSGGSTIVDLFRLNMFMFCLTSFW